MPPPSSINDPKRRSSKLRIGICSRLLLLAALFWFMMQVALVPNNRTGASSFSRVGISAANNRRILYVHIGKTGGEWIKAQLAVICKTRKNPQVQQACLQKFEQSTTPSHVSQQTVGYLHAHNNAYPRNAIHLATHYLFSVRHPLRRLVSWYIYNHPRSCDPRESNSPSCKTNEWKQGFFGCFPTLNELGRSLNLKSPEMTECLDLFRNGWKGDVSNVKDPNHLYWNYEVSF
jgi:hypothetical protein